MPASALRHARLDAGLTLFDVQQGTGIPQSRLSLIERGLVAARPDEQRRVAQVLQLDETQLFPELPAADAASVAPPAGPHRIAAGGGIPARYRDRGQR